MCARSASKADTDRTTDIPAHCYQLTFEQNPAWSKFYAGAKEILEYWKNVVKKYDLRKYMKLSHKILECRWKEEDSKWHVKIQNVTTGETFEDTSDAIMQCIGGLNNWKWPDIQGLHDFKGDLLHSANWDESFDPKVRDMAPAANKYS
jgi:cation diffusion facilitator CzcD-associated flavoprotein CzcO